MSILEQFLSEEFIYALAWTVVHSLWQGILIAIILAVFLHRFRGKSAKLRYEISAFALFTVFIFALTSFIYLFESIQQHSAESLQLFIQSTAAQITEHGILQTSVESSINYFNEHLSLFVSLWFAGALFFLLRLLGAYAYVQKLKRHTHHPISEYWMQRFQQLLKKTPIRKSVRLAESTIAKTPMVIGYFKPIILMPLGAINNLTTAEVESILAHEIAHIYRNDYLINIIQSIIEILFYFNPAVWWISANVRIERENCCDDIAIKLCGNSLAYAKALVKLQEMNLAVPRLAMPLSSNKEHLLNRIKRILNQPQNKSNIMEKITASCFLLVAVLFLSLSSGKASQEEETTTKQPEAITKNILALVEEIPEEEDELVLVNISPDTIIPKKEKNSFSTLHHRSDGKDIRLKMEDGEIKSLEINGEDIPEEDFEDYQESITELLETVPPPPPAPPAPPAPPGPTAVFPTPPAPPSPPRFFLKKNSKMKILKEQDEDGHQIIILDGDGLQEELEIKVDGDELYINGEKMEDGENMIWDNESNFNFRFNKDGEDRIKGFYFNNGDNNFHFKMDSLHKNLWNSQGQLQLLEKDLAEHTELFERLNDSRIAIAPHRGKELKDLIQSYNDVYVADDLAVFPSQKGLFFKKDRGDQKVNQFITTLERELLEDGLIESTKKYKLKLTDRKMKVNGKKQSAGVLKKYHRLYKKITKLDITDGFEIHINKKGSYSKTSISR